MNPTFTTDLAHIRDLSPDAVRRQAMESQLENLSVEYLYNQEGDLLRKMVSSLRGASLLRRLNEKLASSNDELTRFQNVVMGREMKMIELKKQNAELMTELDTYKA